MWFVRQRVKHIIWELPESGVIGIHLPIIKVTGTKFRANNTAREDINRQTAVHTSLELSTGLAKTRIREVRDRGLLPLGSHLVRGFLAQT
jgi:formamidopyrimidine-DNA glycosylase